MKAQRILVLGLIVSASVVLAVGSQRLGGVQSLEQMTLDLRQRTTAEDRRSGTDRTDRPSDVVIVFFDEAAVEGWPWEQPFPREHLAELIESLSGAGVRAIGLDVHLAKLYPDLPGDERLRDAIAAAGNVVLVAPTLPTDSGPRLITPHPWFADVAADIAAGDMPNPFQTTHAAALAVRSGNGLEPGFALAVYAEARGFDVDSLLRDARSRGAVRLPGMPRQLGQIPDIWWEEGTSDQDFALQIPIRYVGPPSHLAAAGQSEVGTFTAYSSEITPTLALFTPEYFQDKIVLLGSGFHDSDKFRTAFSGWRDEDESAGENEYEWMYGVEVHANLLQNMLDEEYLPPLSPRGEVLFIGSAALLAAGAAFLLGAGWGGAVALLVSLSVVAAGVWGWSGEVTLLPGVALMELDRRFLWTPIVAPLMAVFLAYLGSVGYVSIVEGKEKRFIKSAFGKYVSPAVVDQIARNPGALQLGGQKRTISILFSDLAGFTTMSEKLPPEQLIAHLNDYLTEMTDLVMETEGTLDKYIGDAIMAFWNAPTDLADHADRALRCAVLMQRKMGELNRRWLGADPDAETMLVRIGINTGESVVGNVGGESRFDYSAIGDPVNLAARLEPANKSYHTLIMASQFTLEAATQGRFRVRELDLVAVKGKKEPVTVYEVLEESGVRLEDHREEAVAHYEKGLRAYKSRDWELAATCFAAALEAHAQDGPSRVYLERARGYMADPPPTDWDFVVRRTSK